MKQITLLAAVLAFLASCAPGFKQYEALKDPQIRHQPPQKMLVLTVTGNPSAMGGEVGKLYTAYFKLKFKGKSFSQAPLARWPKPFNTPADEWVGVWALPVGNEVASLPEGSPTNLTLENWEYGEVAEILHIGTYDSETPTIERLHRYIEEKGYEIAGPHEEVYLRGPGGPGSKDPKKYMTIIRYVVKPKQK